MKNDIRPGMAIAYLRTSSQANVEGDSSRRQRDAIAEYAKRAGLHVGMEFYDAAVSGADHINQRKGFLGLLAWADVHGVKTVLVENASRFARDIVVQETGYQLLASLGITLIAADDPDAFTADTPTAKMVRQILGVVSEFEKANLVAKLKAARDRKRETGKCEGRKGYAETSPEMVKEAKRLARKNPKTGKARSLREIADELATLGFITSTGKAFAANQVKRLVERSSLVTKPMGSGTP